MDKRILHIANTKIKRLLNQYKGFQTVFLDDWRGFRFVYDTEEIRKFPGASFYKSRLYALLKNEKSGHFSADLYIASWADKRLFGPSLFLNCKTYNQYRDCYVKYLLWRTKTKKEILGELLLLKNLRIIYSQRGNEKILEKKFRQAVVQKALLRADKNKREVISGYVKKNNDAFGNIVKSKKFISAC